MRPGVLRDERGSATVWVLALAGLLAALGASVVLVGAAVVARHRATAAADLAALAGAGRAVMGEPDACATASRIAGANGGFLDGCTVSADAVVEVRVHVPARLGSIGAFVAQAHARAGPVPPDAEVGERRDPAGPGVG